MHYTGKQTLPERLLWHAKLRVAWPVGATTAKCPLGRTAPGQLRSYDPTVCTEQQQRAPELLRRKALNSESTLKAWSLPLRPFSCVRRSLCFFAGDKILCHIVAPHIFERVLSGHDTGLACGRRRFLALAFQHQAHNLRQVSLANLSHRRVLVIDMLGSSRGHLVMPCPCLWRPL